METVTIKGTEEYKKSKYYGKSFDESVTVIKYEHDYQNDTYTITWKQK